ncbi:Fruiting body protein SC3 [Grifola frondosa]|uniref:Hydrophobin n=1 Tax=Grifola frondosa TaxID=5627 RepID=A0A1C7LLK2_GRIFR|nr:Fruiting body protein SC3 [Grifola frondosa]
MLGRENWIVSGASSISAEWPSQYYPVSATSSGPSSNPSKRQTSRPLRASSERLLSVLVCNQPCTSQTTLISIPPSPIPLSPCSPSSPSSLLRPSPFLRLPPCPPPTVHHWPAPVLRVYLHCERPATSELLGLIGVVISDVDALVGLTCSPISVIGVGSGSACTANPVCCDSSPIGGLVSIGCVPVNV